MAFDYNPSELHWSYKNKLGSGSFADVYEGKELKKNRPVALKVTLSLLIIKR